MPLFANVFYSSRNLASSKNRIPLSRYSFFTSAVTDWTKISIRCFSGVGHKLNSDCCGAYPTRHRRTITNWTYLGTLLAVACCGKGFLVSGFQIVPNSILKKNFTSTAFCSSSDIRRRSCFSVKNSRMNTAKSFASVTNDAGDDIKVENTKSRPLEQLQSKIQLSWIEQLNTEKNPRLPSENKEMRAVKNGHYVLVETSPLSQPRLVLYSEDMVQRLHLTEEEVRSEEFTNFFSGNIDATPMKGVTKSWATPYALSIMGTRYTNNCPFGTGEGYGDGRAISIGEVVVDDIDADIQDHKKKRYEMQLKGAGPTPFCRGADGRAVFRSSIREFLASEAMFHLRIPTTRAISLILSEGGDFSNRPWYAEADSSSNSSSPFTTGNARGYQLPTIDDPRLAMYPLETRKQIIAQLSKQKRDPDTMIKEPNAITCRVAPSFTRIGHIDLFARRAALAKKNDGTFDRESQQWRELRDIIWHAAFREFYDEAYAPFYDKDDLNGCITAILTISSENIASMVADWVRVGFAQGNFNADNCLVAGRTMDYGPFGFMDQYDPFFAKWTGSGEHFGFLRQPTAGYVNFVVLVESMTQILREKEDDKAIDDFAENILDKARVVFQDKVNEMWKRKLGFVPNEVNTSASSLWPELEPILRENNVDWTLFWRQLTEVAKEFPIENETPSTNYGDMLDVLTGTEEVRKGSSPFYAPLTSDAQLKMKDWIEKWRKALKDSMSLTNDKQQSVADRMRLENPKYVLREWILVEAYSKAAQGDETVLHQLNDLIKNPYDEGTEEMHEKYYRRAPDEALTAGGTAFMS